MSRPIAAIEPRITGYRIDICDAESCERFLAWLLGDSTDIPAGCADAEDVQWSLAHCDDGVTWGRYDTDAGRWVLGNEVAPKISPLIRREALQELRIFGRHHEIMIWRTDTGLRGRILREAEPEIDRTDETNPLRPSDEPRILRGNIVHRDNKTGTGFTHITDDTGAEQVVPVTVTNEDFDFRRERRQPLRLHLRHYYGQDPCTGAVRIVATRLVELVRKTDHDD